MKSKLKVTGIIATIILICSIFVLYNTINEDLNMYKPTQESLEMNLDDIDGVGKILKVRIGNELNVWIDAINNKNMETIKSVRMNILILLLITSFCASVLTLCAAGLMVSRMGFYSLEEHRVTQNMFLKFFVGKENE